MKRQIMYRCFDTLQGGKFEYWNPETDKYDGVFWTMIKNKSFKEPNLFTGLKDMAGKDIYEGDILDSRVQPNPMPITIDDFHGYQFKIGKGLLCKADAMYGEVIGNIYENPELLVPKI